MIGIRSGRQIGIVWAIAVVIFYISAKISIALTPPEPVTSPPASYWVGLVGLLAIGIALALTWYWASREGPVSDDTRGLVKFLVLVGAFLWLLAMVFPFL